MGLVDQISRQYKFLGATVKAFSMSGGNGSPITLTVNLIEDAENGDAFDPPPVWSPVTFEFENLRFGGLLQYQIQKMDLQDYPGYQVVVVDPREALDGVQIILDGANDAIDVPNVLNVFGYWENILGFGGAMTNDAGMLWSAGYPILGIDADGQFATQANGNVGIKPAIEAMTRAKTRYGGPIRFRGHSYSLDLSGLPSAPEHYRINGGVVVTLAEVIRQLCEDSGCDYQVFLDGTTIKFRSLDRNRPQSPGTLANWAGSQPNVQAKSIGVEAVNEYANAIVWGGRVQSLNTIYGGGDAIWPYWGFDDNGVVIWGDGAPEEGHVFNLPCSNIAGIVGSSVYPCSIAELRMAAADQDSWASFVMANDPDKAEFLGLVGFFDAKSDLFELFGDAILKRDLMGASTALARSLGGVNDSDYWSRRVQQIYEFVAGYAREYLGSKFLVRLPFVVRERVIPDTTTRAYSDEISDGGYADEASAPLGLPYSEIDAFLLDDGRFGCFVAFNRDDRMNLSALDPEASVVTPNTVYMRATVDPMIVHVPGQIFPYAVVTLDQPIFQIPADPLGGVEDIANALGLSLEQVQFMAGIRGGSFPVRIFPSAYRPAAAAVPTKSNTRSYGPWRVGDGSGQGGGDGKTHCHQDDAITPWNCGGIDAMNEFAMAQITSMITGLREIETATIEMVGTPDAQIGDVLVAGGPSITSIDVAVGTSGVTTRYAMRTYTPSFGAFGRDNADRVRRLSLASRQLRRQIRNLNRRGRLIERTRRREYQRMMEGASAAVVQRSPHECLVAQTVKDKEGRYRSQISTASCDELLANMRADDSTIFQSAAGMGLEGLLRPFSSNADPEDDREDGLPHFQKPDDDVWSDNYLLSTEDMNPFKDCDVDLLTTGREYEGNLHRKKGDVEPNYDDARGLALRGPLVVAGWGLEMTGKPVPNAGDETRPIHEWDDEFLDDHKLQPDKWRAGTVALMWNEWLGAWVAPTRIFGKAVSTIPDGQSGDMLIELKDGQYGEDRVTVKNGFGSTIQPDTYLGADYNMMTGKWVIGSARC